jgi:hypothetical protein
MNFVQLCAQRRSRIEGAFDATRRAVGLTNWQNMTDKLAWCDAFDTYLHQLDAVKPVIWYARRL